MVRVEILSFVILIAAGLSALPATSEPIGPPNVLVILADDLGWRDVHYHGAEFATPEIDRIARMGFELDRFYVQPTCSPTRTGLMTGKSPIRLGVTRPISKNEETGLPLPEKLLPAYFGDAGYPSLMAGKWPLGHFDPRFFPDSRGFEYSYGLLSGGIGYWDHTMGGGLDRHRDGVTLREEHYSTGLIANEAIRLLDTRDRSRPTFLYVAFNAPHLPNEAPEPTLTRQIGIEKLNRRVHAAMVTQLDRAMGRVLEAFEREGLTDNTLVLFSNDNGGLNQWAAPPPIAALNDFLVATFDRPMPLEFLVSNVEDGGSDNSPLPSGKGSIAEGGVRVPAAIW